MCSISDGNVKLGTIHSLSLPPVLTCNPDAPCRRKGQCYAIAMTRYAPGVVKAWGGNLDQWQTDPAGFEAEMMDYFEGINAPRFFRWFVGGDVCDGAFWQMIVRIAAKCPGVRFLMFTKQYGIVGGRTPGNLQVVASGWPGLPIPRRIRRQFRVAWMRDEKNPDPRIPADAIECPGHCDKCGMCWDLAAIGRDVVFEKH